MATNVIKAKVIGIRNYSFDAKEGGKVEMCQLYCTFEDERTQGTACCTTNALQKKMVNEGVRIGSEVNLIFYDKKWQYLSI